MADDARRTACISCGRYLDQRPGKSCDQPDQHPADDLDQPRGVLLEAEDTVPLHLLLEAHRTVGALQAELERMRSALRADAAQRALFPRAEPNTHQLLCAILRGLPGHTATVNLEHLAADDPGGIDVHDDVPDGVRTLRWRKP